MCIGYRQHFSCRSNENIAGGVIGGGGGGGASGEGFLSMKLEAVNTRVGIENSFNTLTSLKPTADGELEITHAKTRWQSHHPRHRHPHLLHLLLFYQIRGSELTKLGERNM